MTSEKRRIRSLVTAIFGFADPDSDERYRVWNTSVLGWNALFLAIIILQPFESNETVEGLLELAWGLIMIVVAFAMPENRRYLIKHAHQRRAKFPDQLSHLDRFYRRWFGSVDLTNEFKNVVRFRLLVILMLTAGCMATALAGCKSIPVVLLGGGIFAGIAVIDRWRAETRDGYTEEDEEEEDG